MKTISNPKLSKAVKGALSKTGNDQPSKIGNTPSPKNSNTMAVIMLTCLSTLCLLLFAKAGKNKDWFQKISYYWNSFIVQKDSDATLEQIKEERWGPTYAISKQIKVYMEQKKIKDPILLFEPNGYIVKQTGNRMPEPIVFYYYTGMKAVLTNSNNVHEATHFIRFTKKKLFIDTISSKAMLQQIINAYKVYPQ